MASIELDAPGTTHLLLGNEAIARGALEAGIGFAASYPGTPASEIMDTLSSIAKKMGIHAEWSVNEKVALEAAAGASFAGIRAIASMKQNGINVASDFLINLAMTGIGKGLVAVVADDPGAISSTNEQDSRNICKWMNLPLLEVSNAQDAKDITKWAFDLSEQLDTICIVRSVNRIGHTRGNVELGKLPKSEHRAYFPIIWDMFKPTKSKFTTGPFIELHKVLLQKLAKAEERFEASPYNYYTGPEKAELLIITSGACTHYCTEAVKELKLENNVGIFKLATTWPLPEKLVSKQLSRSQRVLFVEESDPFIERSIMELAANLSSDSPRLVFYGKRSGHIPLYGELHPDIVISTIDNLMGVTYVARDITYEKEANKLSRIIPGRTLNLCPGCPHRATFWAVKNALQLDGRDGFVCGDIGCYSLGFAAGGYYQLRTMHAMGSGIGVANGLGRLSRFGFGQPVIAMVGDSTFLHAAIPALINGVYNKSNFILLILDNNATAMTGFQPHPGTGMTATGEPTFHIDIEALCRSLGAHVEVCDPFELENTINTLLRLMAEAGGAKVVIMRRECEMVRAKREKRFPYVVSVDPEICIGEACGCNRVCTRVFQCPGLIYDQEVGKAIIDEAVCTGCGLCADICPHGAIIKKVAES
jgi:indolepyruvate ferredoxin oxidoreductase alpha subunit